MKNTPLVFFIVFIISTSLYAQNSPKSTIKGVITDQESEEPLISASVFLENTTFGTVSDASGKYVITNIDSGSYYFVVSAIGYELKRIPVRIEKGEKLEFNMKLKQKAIVLDEVNIIGKKTDDWNEYIKVFEREFLGDTKNAKWTKVINPEIINFTKDPDTRLLSAFTDSTIIVENRALGYKLFILLADFSFDLKNGVNYLTRIIFQELTPTDNDEKEMWKNNREECYIGSQKHFFNSLLNKRLHQEGFRLSQGPLYLLTSGMGIYIWEDGLSIEEDQDDLLRLNLDTCFKIECQKNQTVDYIIPVSRYILLDKSGNRMDGNIMNVGGHWAKQRISDALPYNYVFEK